MRVLLRRLWGRDRVRLRSWAVDPRLVTGEADLWRELGIDVVAEPLEPFAGALGDAVGS